MILFKNVFVQILSVFLMFLLILILQIGEIESKTIVKRSIMDDINKGLKYAGQMMGINTAADVANLVARAFSNQNTITKKEDTETLSSSYVDTSSPHHQQTSKDEGNSVNPALLLSGVLKMMGFDSGKLGALALNGIIMIAQMIGSAFMPSRLFASPPTANDGEQHHAAENDEENDVPHNARDDHQPRMNRRVRQGSPLDWILENPSEEFSKVLQNIRDNNLPNYLSEAVDKLEQENGDGDCIKMLICKSSPFVWGMQKNVGDRIDGTMSVENDESEENGKGNRLSEFFKYLPSIQEYRKHGQLCEDKYFKCNATARVLK